MALAIAHQGLGHLLRRRDTDVGDKIPMQSLGVEKIQDVLDEVGAIARNCAEMRVVRTGVQRLDKPVVFLGASLNLKTVNRAVISRSDELIPISARCLSIDPVGDDSLQIFAAILITEE